MRASYPPPPAAQTARAMQEQRTSGSSCSSTKISAVAAPSSRSRRHHSASRALLPKPAGRGRPRQPALRRHGERRQRGALRIARQPLRDRGCPARQPGKRPPARGFAPRTRSLRPARFVQQPCRAEGRAGDRRRTSRRAALVTHGLLGRTARNVRSRLMKTRQGRSTSLPPCIRIYV